MDFEGGDKAEPTLAQKAQDKIKNVKYDADEDGHHINGFNCIPRKQTPFDSVAADKLRSFLLILLAFHSLCLVFEVLIYYFLFAFFVGECFKFWLCYYCFMTMNNVALYSYVLCLFLAALGGALSIFDVGIWFPIFAAQIGAYGYGGYLLFLKIKDFTDPESSNKKASEKSKMLDEKLTKGSADLEKQAMDTAKDIKDKAIDKASTDLAAKITDQATATASKALDQVIKK